MKTSITFLFIVLLVAVSCTKSRFATTTRHYQNGKVVYRNHFSNDTRTRNPRRIKPPAPIHRDAPALAAGDPVDHTPAIASAGLIASSNSDILLYDHIDNSTFPVSYGISPENPEEGEPENKEGSGRRSSLNHSKSPSKEISRSDKKTLKESKKSNESKTGNVKANGPKTDTMGILGFIFSFLGIIPLIGIPFGVMAIVFGGVSLRRIKRNPEKYKGKELAIAGIVIGCIMIAVNVIVIAASINAVNNTPAPTINTSSTTCRV